MDIKKVTWLAGWGVEPESLRGIAERALPAATHAYLPALTPELAGAMESEFTVGWSLGAWRLLKEGSLGAQFAGQVILLAPFVAFCAENDQGGRSREAHVRWLKRWVQRDRGEALRDFFARAGLTTVTPATSAEGLAEGLDELLRTPAPEMIRFAAGLPANWRAFVGEHDELLIPQRICRMVGGCRVVGGAGHDPAALMAAILNEI